MRSPESTPLACPAPRLVWLPALVLALAGAAAAVIAPPAGAAPPSAVEAPAHPPRPQAADPAARADRMVDRLLMGVDHVRPEQRSQLKALAAETLRERADARQAGQALRQRELDLLAQPSLDAAAYERLGQERAAHRDKMAQRVAQAKFQAAQILSPAQRQQLAQRLARRGGADHPRGGGGEGPRGGFF